MARDKYGKADKVAIKKVIIPMLNKILEESRKKKWLKEDTKLRERLIGTILQMQKVFTITNNKGEEYTLETLQQEPTEELINTLEETLEYAEKMV